MLERIPRIPNAKTMQAGFKRNSIAKVCFMVAAPPMARRIAAKHRKVARSIAKDLRRVTSYNVLAVVSGDGEHHDATAISWDFLVNRGSILSLRLHPHAEIKKKATNGNVAASGAGRTSAQLFRSRRRKGRWLEGQRRTGH
jgi:hypothetical protein